MAGIKLKNIHKTYQVDGRVFPVLNGIDLEIPAGKITVILGQSGCGKTTTLRILSGFETPDAGKVLFNGQDITQLPPNKRQLNTVFQKYALFTHMSIAENIAFGLKIKGKSKSYIDDKIKYALKLVNLDGFENRSVGSLSGGQQQRIAIARAMLKDAPIIILDEATSSVDPENEDELQRAIEALTHDKTIIMIAHRLKTVRNADQILVLDNAHIVQRGTHAELIQQKGLYADFVSARQEAIGWKLAQ